MALAMTRPTKDSRGVYEYKARYPKDLAHLFKPHARWKRSLSTRDPSEAAKRFPAIHQECQQHFAMLRAVHLEGFQFDARDAQQIAARWFHARLAELEVSGDYAHYLAVIDVDVLDEKTGESFSAVEWHTLQDIEGRGPAAAVAPFIREALHSHQLPEPEPESSAYCLMVDAFWPTLCDLSSLCLARIQAGGRFVAPPPTAPHVPLSFEVQATSAPRLSHVFDKWAEDKRQTDPGSGKTIDEFGMTVRRFQELYGDVEVRSISRALVGEFRIALGKIPTKGDGIRGLPAPQAIARAEAEGLPTASLPTIRKQLRGLSAVLNFGVQRLQAMPEEPIAASGMLRTLAKAARRAETRTREDKSYERAELCRIFSSPLFRGQWRPMKADYGQALYWLPLLLAYTGARREELAQLFAAEVCRCSDSGIWYLSIRPVGDNSVKQANSRRRVPLHDDLIELGFLRYVEELPKAGRLFPALKAHRSNGYGHAVGRAWGKYLENEVGLESEADPAHGFRHTFKGLCREVYVEASVIDWITGHADPNVGALYGPQPLQRMAEELKKFPSIARMAGLLSD